MKTKPKYGPSMIPKIHERMTKWIISGVETDYIVYDNDRNVVGHFKTLRQITLASDVAKAFLTFAK